MSRPIVLSNGELHVGINKFGLVHDFYFPYVGLENHSAGQNMRHKIGIWAEGQISWLDTDEDWQIDLSYHTNSLIGRTRAQNDRLGVLLEFDDAVHTGVSAFMRNIHIVNLRGERRDIRLFMHQAFVIGDSRSNTDTAQYLPDSNAILHYRGSRAFVISGESNGKPFDQYTVGLFGIEGHEGTYRDADDGELSFSNVEHGQVDSALRFRFEIDPQSSARASYWVAAGKSIRDALYVHKHTGESSIGKHLDEVDRHWKDWLRPAKEAASRLKPEYRDSFLRSALILKSQIDKRGAIMASTDTAMLNYWRDAYAYSWPRDGAYIVWPLIRMGYVDEPRRFFEFCKRGLHPSGYLMHKYRADGALGSSWHPYIHDGVVAPPIQEDETAVVLFVFSQFYKQNPSEQLLNDFYEPMIKPMANFMSDYIDETTGLPKPSYDLWEEVYLTTTYSTAATYAALLAAADLADITKDSDSAVRWRMAANDIADAAHRYLFNHSRGAFYKGLIVKDGQIEYNETIDNSSLFGVFMYGLYSTDSDEVKSALKVAEEVFGVTPESPGMPRYENDNYCRVDSGTLGNWWIISTLWRAQYYRAVGETKPVEEALTWVKGFTEGTGILPEQVSPTDNSFVSVAPLTWSHAEYLSTLLDTIE